MGVDVRKTRVAQPRSHLDATMTQHPPLSYSSGVLFAVAAIALGQALQVNNGFFHGRALSWLTLAVMTMVAACFAPRPQRDIAAAPLLRLVLLAGVLWQLTQLLTARPLLYSPLRHGRDDVVLAVSLGSMAALAIAIAFGSPAIRRWAFVGVLVAHAAACVRTIQLVPEPRIDVVTVHEAAFDAIADGRSPYGITFKNIYGSSSRFYGEGMASDSEVRFGFPYPPLALALTAPAHWALGDYRYALVAALVGVAVMLGAIGWSRHAMLSATVLLTTPRVLFEIEQGWTEPIVLLMLVWLVLSLRRRPAAAGVVAGLGFAVKQYLAVGLLLLPLTSTAPRSWGRTAGIAIGVAAALTLPFLIWDPQGFMRSVVMLQLREPFRLDSLSYLAWIARRGVEPPTVAVTLLAVAAAAGLAWRTLPRSPGGFAAGMAIVSAAAFVFGKKAFCNYYFFVIGALLTSVAAVDDDVEGEGHVENSRARRADSQ